MTPTLDLTRRAWTRPRGHLTLIGTWIWQEEHRRWRPCMVIVRTGEEMSDRTVPCVITADHAWIWSVEIGDLMRAAYMTGGFLDALRLEPDDRTIIAFVNMIHDHLGDLLSIPPMPRLDDGRVVAEITMRDRATGATREVALTDV